MAKASIVIPVYNKDKYLKDTLISVDKQTENDLEVIIVDDASSDSSMDVINDFANNTKKQTKIIRNDCNSGVAYSRNIGIDEAKSEYISFLDADDILDDNYIEKMLEKANKYPFIDYINGVCVPFNLYGILDSGMFEGYNDEKLIVPVLDQDYIGKSTVACTARLYKKESIKNLKFVESAFEDYEYFLSSMASNLTLLYTKEAKYYYRVIPDGKYQTSIGKLIKCIDHFDIYDRVESRYPDMNLAVSDALKTRHVSICLKYFQLLLPFVMKMDPIDSVEFYKNYLQYINVRYNVEKEAFLDILKDAGELSNDPEILKENIKKIVIKY